MNPKIENKKTNFVQIKKRYNEKHHNALIIK